MLKVYPWQRSLTVAAFCISLVAVSAASAPKALGTRAGVDQTVEKAWENYDFVPGERVLFADDLSQDRVGNFPKRLQLVEGNAQVVETKGGRWLQSTSSPTLVQINLPEPLPQRFTIEFDVVMQGSFPLKFGIGNPGEGDPDFESDVTTAFVGPFGAGLAGGGVKITTPVTIDGKTREDLAGTQVRVRVQADEAYMKLYVNERRVANSPNTKFGRAKQLIISTYGTDEAPVLTGNFTVAAGGLGLYDALLEKGRVATQGILFDTGSDRIRPESSPTLKQIAEMLQAHADLKLMIEGHTDNVGAPAANLALSSRRAAAVKTYLTGTLKIDGARLQTVGLGDTKPAGSNATPEGKQQNRRVELVKM